MLKKNYLLFLFEYSYKNSGYISLDIQFVVTIVDKKVSFRKTHEDVLKTNKKCINNTH